MTKADRLDQLAERMRIGNFATGRGCASRREAVEGRILGPANRIIREVAKRRSLTEQQIVSRFRYDFLVDARREIAHRLRNELQYSTPRIGLFLRLHHTTVLNLLKRPAGPPGAVPAWRVLPADWKDSHDWSDDDGVWAI